MITWICPKCRKYKDNDISKDVCQNCGWVDENARLMKRIRSVKQRLTEVEQQ